MKPIANFEIVEETEDCVLIRDLGPWDEFATVSDAAEEVVEALAPELRGRRLELIDSDGDRWEMFVNTGQFAGFTVVS